ncbi:uncharacterized protein LOC135478086 [Liolophura sinensis]|uniref:uncharacterized protein LOC135478086 n=1 Tax=Liolophura sinensis TaxID=3198878 RepID=UPI0031588F39
MTLNNNQAMNQSPLCHRLQCHREQSPGLEFEAARHELRFAVERIAELEESLMGKQVALDSVVTENDRLKAEVASHHAQQQMSSERPRIDGTTEFISPEVCKELSAPVNGDSYSSETHQLLQQVQLLQVQLQQVCVSEEDM